MNLFGQTLEELQTLCGTEGWPRFTARQICDWLYAKRVGSIDDMTNLSLKVRGRLSEIATLEHMLPQGSQTSVDGTKKYLFYPSADGIAHGAVEAVFIPDSDRATLCLSCQQGCRMGCRFCVTGRQTFRGSLTSAQILSQILCLPEYSRLSNLVFMGMGEPMDNYDAVLTATKIITADWGLGWSPRRITVSSVGITPQVKRFVEESQCHLAISLHNPIAAQRQEIMPMQKAYPINNLIDMLKGYDWSGQRRLSFEYIMFDGLNDSRHHADALRRLLGGLNCRVNLIRFHTSPDMPFRTSSDSAIREFRDYLNQRGIICTVRASRGEDIMAACGLLAGNNSSLSKMHKGEGNH